ncbi:MAG: hypothetical protein HLUCCA12_14775 [Rhodobacteraceae bacterium HLUCCA12]|nr:MAG: hypothetical protein HLUCCA12_14775 [Rhodobacteraceae bacterium HLUCCA12]
MIHPCQNLAEERIAALRSAAFSEEHSESCCLADALFLDLDPDEGKARLSCRSEPGMIAALDARVEGAPRWLVARIDLGPGTFRAGDVLALTLQASAERDCALEITLRTLQAEGPADLRFVERPALTSQQNVVTVMHTITGTDAICGDAQFASLLLNLPKQDFRITLHDMHFFVLPAERGLRSEPRSLSSFAA